jgi:hypothetical protein
MSEQLPSVKRGLLNSDDPELWASEFVRIFSGKMIMVSDQHDGGAVDEATLTDWFKRAMATAREIDERKARVEEQVTPLGAVPETVREAFVEGAEEGRGESTEPASDPTA